MPLATRDHSAFLYDDLLTSKMCLFQTYDRSSNSSISSSGRSSKSLDETAGGYAKSALSRKKTLINLDTDQERYMMCLFSITISVLAFIRFDILSTLIALYLPLFRSYLIRYSPTLRIELLLVYFRTGICTAVIYKFHVSFLATILPCATMNLFCREYRERSAWTYVHSDPVLHSPRLNYLFIDG